jgi:hypothetical protein
MRSFVLSLVGLPLLVLVLAVSVRVKPVTWVGAQTQAKQKAEQT